LCANYAEAIVTIQQIGTHDCGFNGFKTQKDVRFIARHNDRLELLYGRYAYEIEFNPPPQVEYFTSKKRFHELEADEIENRMKVSKVDDLSDEESKDDEKKMRLSASGNRLDQDTLSAGSSRSSEESNSNPSLSAKWESFDGGKLMIYTASSVQNQSKVISTAVA
jgi:hypothetical protein